MNEKNVIDKYTKENVIKEQELTDALLEHEALFSNQKFILSAASNIKKDPSYQWGVLCVLGSVFLVMTFVPISNVLPNVPDINAIKFYITHWVFFILPILFPLLLLVLFFRAKSSKRNKSLIIAISIYSIVGAILSCLFTLLYAYGFIFVTIFKGIVSDPDAMSKADSTFDVYFMLSFVLIYAFFISSLIVIIYGIYRFFAYLLKRKH